MPRPRPLTDRDVARRRGEHFDRLADPVELVYFHGGVPGLKLGDRILPPATTGATSLAEYAPGHATRARRDRVYMTDQEGEAAMFAAMHPSNRGEVYVVEPLPPVELDPDYLGPGDHAWMAAEAMVVRRLGGLPPDATARIRARLMGLSMAGKLGRRR
jgi:hypothetical protein